MGESEHSSNSEKLEFEKAVLLAEYKAHHEEIFKWNSFMNQAVGGFIGVLSIIAAIIARSGICGRERELLLGVVYVSLVLLSILFQFRYVVVVRHKYMASNLRRRICALCFDDNERLKWDSFLIGDREEKRKSKKWLYWLTKFGITLPPYLIIISASVVYAIKYFCEDICNRGGLQAPSFIPPWLVLVLMVVAFLLTVWHFCGFSSLSKEEKGCGGIEVQRDR